MNFDDIDFAKLSESERQEIIQLWRDDKYNFYARWDNSAEVQKKMIAWQRETIPNYDERSVDNVFEVIGALKAAGAPQNVVDYYKSKFAAPDPFINAKPTEKLTKVVEFFNALYDNLNWDEEGLPEYSNKNLDHPLHQKWLDIVDGVYFLMADKVKHRVNMKHYRRWETSDEVIEISPPQADFSIYVGEAFSIITPDCIKTECDDSGNTIVKLIFFMCYSK